jgi:hypothetical protein
MRNSGVTVRAREIEIERERERECQGFYVAVFG